MVDNLTIQGIPLSFELRESGVLKNPCHGEETSEQAQKDNAKLRSIFTPLKGSSVANSIKIVKVSGVVRGFADRITTVFGRRAVFFSASPGAGLPNGLIDRNDPNTIYVHVNGDGLIITI